MIKMSSMLSDSYSEVSYILDILGNKYKSKVPKEILNLIYSNRNDNYKIDVNLNELEISRNALIIISILNLKYWENDKIKKTKLKQIYSKNEQMYQNRIKQYKNQDCLKETNNIKGNGIIIKKEKSIWNTIKRIIKGILYIKK